MTNTEKVIDLLNRSHSVFHAVKNIRETLNENGFIRLTEQENFVLEEGKKYYVERNNTSIIAFKIPVNVRRAFNITATHNDSPTYKLKPNPLIRSGQYYLLSTEPYGGMIHSTWLDKPLSIAGRVFVKKENEIQSLLVDIDEDLLMIPNLCIHFNREINKGYAYNPAIDLRPVLTSYKEDFSFEKFLAEKCHIEGEILSHDLFLYNREKAAVLGAEKEFLASPRLDDLSSAYSALLGFLNAEPENHIALYSSFDNEEVGSLTRQGANSTFLKDVIKRILIALDGDADRYEEAIASSYLLSIDNAHANHPNYPQYTDATTQVILNEGIVIKYNADQSYTTDALSSAIVKMLCDKASVSYQEFTNKSDIRGGSTLGNISNSEVSLISADIGLPQWAMHSSYETMGIRDLESMIALVNTYFTKDIQIRADHIEIQ